MDKVLLSKTVEDLERLPGMNVTALGALKDWILQSDVHQRIRINPYDVAEYSGLPVGKILPVMLRAVREGMLDLHWEVHCPHCDMIAHEYGSLFEMRGGSSCTMCDKEFDADFLHRVEVTFSLNRMIEDTGMPPVCMPVPAMDPRCIISVGRGQTGSAEDFFEEEGEYRYSCPVTQSKGILKIEGERTDRLREFVIEQLPEKRFRPERIRARPGKLRFVVKNDHFPLSGMVVYRDDLPVLGPEEIPARLSGLELLHYPEYRELFGDQVLSEREKIEIGAVTTMFTDIKGSTELYERIGDASAYNLVHDHFEIVFGEVEKSGGMVIKTIGDAVMASFVSNKQAVGCAVALIACFGNYNRDHDVSKQVNIKIGIHRCPAILVNLNGRLDYFGSSVNKAARIQRRADANELAFSQEIRDDETAMELLGSTGPAAIQKEMVNLRGIGGKQEVYKVRLG